MNYRDIITMIPHGREKALIYLLTRLFVTSFDMFRVTYRVFFYNDPIFILSDNLCSFLNGVSKFIFPGFVLMVLVGNYSKIPKSNSVLVETMN